MSEPGRLPLLLNELCGVVVLLIKYSAAELLLILMRTPTDVAALSPLPSTTIFTAVYPVGFTSTDAVGDPNVVLLMTL